jgi:hypothetical protein
MAIIFIKPKLENLHELSESEFKNSRIYKMLKGSLDLITIP